MFTILQQIIIGTIGSLLASLILFLIIDRRA